MVGVVPSGGCVVGVVSSGGCGVGVVLKASILRLSGDWVGVRERSSGDWVGVGE